MSSVSRCHYATKAGMSDSGQESIWDIQTAYNVVSGRVATRDYNYREALTPQDSTESISSQEGSPPVKFTTTRSLS